MVDALSVATMAARRMLPPLQNLGMNDLPGDVLQEIAEKMIDLENPADVCAKWAEWCRVMKNGPAMCTNPDDGAEAGVRIARTGRKELYIDLRVKTRLRCSTSCATICTVSPRRVGGIPLVHSVPGRKEDGSTRKCLASSMCCQHQDDKCAVPVR